MSWFKKITSLFTSDDAATPPARADAQGPTEPPPPDLPKPPDVPGWSGPETQDRALHQAVCQLMEWVTHPAFSRESYEDEAFQEHLERLAAHREFPDLIEVLRRALLSLRDHPPLLRRLAQIYTDAYDNSSAERLWKRLIELGYDKAEANYKLGELAERDARLAEAAAYYQRALAYDVSVANAWQRAVRLKEHLPMPQARAAVTMGGVDGVAGDPAAGVGVRPPDGFELRHPLGRGGFGTVYLARDARLHRDVAIKFLHPHLTQDSRRVDAFFDEARLVARLALPGVVRIYDLAPDDRVIIMEYLTRGTLRDRLASGRPLSLQAALRVAHALLTTLGRIHDAGLIHRDLKPENILFRSDNSAVLGDFGTAILEDDDRLLETRPAGTVAYMAPELKRPLPDHTPDRRVDLYSVGLVLVEMIAGVLPPAPAMAVHDPDLLISLLPSRARQLLDRPLRHLLAEDPAQRPSSALLIADDLARARQLLDQETEDRRLLDDFQRLAHLDGDPDPATAAYLEMVTRELTRVEDAPQPGPEQF